MSFSSLISRSVPHHGKMNLRAGNRVRKIIVHHWAGTAGGDVRLMNPAEAVSASYIIYGDGTIVGQVPETHRPWTSGGWDADKDAITIEVQNSGGRAAGRGDDDPASWPVSDAAWSALVRLCADVARRYKFGSVALGSTLRFHREFQATACPGGFIWSRRGGLRDAVNKAIGGGAVPRPKPAPVSRYSVAQLADQIMYGSNPWGNDPERTQRLTAAGYDARAVQAEINRRLFGAPAPQVAVDIDRLAQAVLRGEYGNGDERVRRLGANYAAVQARVNQLLYGEAAAAPVRASKSVHQLALEIINGVNGVNPWGNGDERVRRLTDAGYNYAAVQAEVNRLLG